MDAISNIGKTIGGVVNGGGGGTPIWQTLLKLGVGGAGTIGNILASNKRNQVLNQSLQNQKDLMNLTPGQLAAQASAIEQPLSAGLTSSVGNAVQGYLAERGLSQAPGIQATTLAQGLAPYKIQEQQLAMNSLLQKLGLPAQATPRFLPYPQGTDLSKLFQMLFTRKDPMTGNAGGGSGFPTTGPDMPNPDSGSNPSWGYQGIGDTGINYDWINAAQPSYSG